MEQTIEKLKEKARSSWSGVTGEKRAEELEKYLRGKLEEYSKALNIPQEEILNAWEKDRTYSAINYYQEANQPSLNAEHVRVFDTIDDLLHSIGDKEFRCPCCEEITTNPYACNSKAIVDKKGKVCDWKSYGLFGTMNKGVFVYIKEKLQGEHIFMPVSWEKKEVEAE